MYDELTNDNCLHSKDPVVGCALEGVAGIIAGIRDVCVVIHSPQGCAATVALGYDHHEIDFTKRKVACTRLFETDIIMGAEDKLKDLIRQADKTFGSKVIFVVGTCSADIIGEDLKGICRVVQPEVNAELIPVFAGGFRGDAYKGMDHGLLTLFRLIKPFQGQKNPRSVNLIVPQANQNPTWRADLQWVTHVLDVMGVSVQCVFPRDASLHDIRHASQASANILLSHDVGYDFARKMEDTFGVPLLLADIPLPVGLKNTARWLTALGECMGAQDAAQKMIAEGEEMVVDVLRRRGLMIIPRYRNCRLAISSDMTIGIGLVRMFFEELEMIPEVLLFRSDNPRARDILKEELKSMGISPKTAFGVDGYQVKQALGKHRIDAVLGSAWETYLAEELGIRLAFDVLAPTNRDVYVDRAYFGYEGMLNILEKVANDWETAFRSREIRWEQYDDEPVTEALSA